MSLTSVPMVGDKELLEKYGPTVPKVEVSNSLEFERLRLKGYYTTYTREDYGWTDRATSLLRRSTAKVAPYGPKSPHER